MKALRRLGLACFVFLASTVLRAQSPTPAPAALDWSSEDSARVAYLTVHGRSYSGPNAVVWGPLDSLDQPWLAAFTDSLATSVDALRRLMGGAYAWQRLGQRPITFYFSLGRFISHASGAGAVFISVTRVRQRTAPFLHEAAHELLAPPAPFSPDEYPDSAAGERAAAQFPLWLTEGLADYLAQATAAATGFPEGDVFAIGGLAKVDSTCAARLAASPRRDEIVAKVGAGGMLDALFTTERAQVAPIFYVCSQSFTKYLVDRVGIRTVVAAFPGIPANTWETDFTAAAKTSLGALRRTWLETVAKSGGP